MRVRLGIIMKNLIYWRSLLGAPRVSGIPGALFSCPFIDLHWKDSADLYRIYSKNVGA